MGHSVIECGRCGNMIMEGRNDFSCDTCGWTSGCKQSALDKKREEEWIAVNGRYKKKVCDKPWKHK